MQRKRESVKAKILKETHSPLSDNGSSSYRQVSGNRLFQNGKPGQPTLLPKENPGELLKYSKRLRQDQLILAEFESAGEPEVAEPTEEKTIMIS